MAKKKAANKGMVCVRKKRVGGKMKCAKFGAPSDKKVTKRKKR
jgi:hypothetical protein